uniref:Serine/threonine-protein kinase BSK1-like TPR repeats domain-containing protein n=1 Tax=Aegilops tauschii subsp. strangulata TaxID=200361 RepID=A0A452XPI3_AEGTS
MVNDATVLHHAATVGSCKVTEFLLSKGVPVDIHYGYGTPLHLAATNEQDKIVKILLEHHADGGADVNRMTSLLMTPLVFTSGRKDYTNFMQFLLKAGADPNIPDGFGRLPIEHAGRRDCMEQVEMLFPLTSPIPSIPNWSIDGIISYEKFESAKPLDQRHLERAKAIFKSQADYAFRLKDYKFASKSYDLAIDAAPTATLYANRSLCKLMLDDGEGALSDALSCRMMRPNWAKACYRQAVAHMLLKEYKQACDALLDAQKLDPGNIEVERELRKARELMKAP